MLKRSGRPVFLDLIRIRLPAVGLMSIGHRASGVLLFLSIPYVIYLLELSLSGPEGFSAAAAQASSFWFKLLVIPWAWSLGHHFLAGLRFLLIDIDIGIERSVARATSIAVMVGGVLIAAIVALGGWL